MSKVVHMSVRSRYRVLVVCTVAALVCLLTLRFGTGRGGERQGGERPRVPASLLQADFFSWKGPGYVPRPKPPYKPAREPGAPVPDPFPLLSQNLDEREVAGLLRAPAANRPPRTHHAEGTPLLIGFTRNWPQLLQCVVSYVAAGWPASDVYVVENTGVMRANARGQLSLQNPFYLNHTQLRMLGVGVITAPTLLTFAQLQNFYAYTALERGWPEYFWSHQDVVVFSREHDGSPTLYDGAVGVLRYLRRPEAPRWANHFFAYDHLTLVNRDALLDVGGWDTHIPFYAADCDMYARLMWAGYWQGESDIGIILDVATVLDDVGALLRIPGIRASFAGDPGDPGPPEEDGDGGDADAAGESWDRLVRTARRMEALKSADGGGRRNAWQLRQTGGQGEPFSRDPEGFETGLRMLIDTGRSVFAEKWGHRGCDIAAMGITAEDAWRLERDWDVETEGLGFEGDEW